MHRRFSRSLFRSARAAITLLVVLGVPVLFAVPPVSAEDREPISVRLQAVGADYDHQPVRLALDAAESMLGRAAVVLDDSGRVFPGQIGRPHLLAEVGDKPDNAHRHEVTFVPPELEQGDTMEFELVIPEPGEGLVAGPSFSWHVESGKYEELRWNDRPVWRYMHEVLDNSTPERREETYKVYHHLFDPTGSRLVTKGPGGLYPHHRGLFYGFNRITYGEGRRADVWHCRNGESQEHVETVFREAGPVYGRHRAVIDWKGTEGDVFAREERELTAYHVEGGILVDIASRLHSQVEDLVLDGDPQHAGFQFRASQEVPDSTSDQTYYLRPDGRGEPGQFRNWPGHEEHVDLPWNALSFVLGDQRYTCAYLDHPDNPKEARYSERNYGRFGSYFEYRFAERDGGPLEIRYRLWLQEGEMEVEAVDRMFHCFVHSPAVVQE